MLALGFLLLLVALQAPLISLLGTLASGRDVDIDVNCIFEGDVSLGDEVSIGANCVIRNARIEAGAVIHPFTHIDGDRDGATVGEGALRSALTMLSSFEQLEWYLEGTGLLSTGRLRRGIIEATSLSIWNVWGPS